MPIFAFGTACLTAAVIVSETWLVCFSYAVTATGLSFSFLPVTDGLVAGRPASPPVYDEVAS